MKGAIVFLVFFIVTTALSLYVDIPPGKQIYEMLDVPETEYPVGGIPATVLIISLFNGIIYGIVAWLVYSIIMAAKRRKKSQNEVVSTEQKKFCINCGAELPESATYCGKCGATK
jgi:ribosomal protein L40E